MSKLKNFIDRKFGISAKGGTIGNEIIAGFTTFATMAYVLAVQSLAITGGKPTFVDVNGVELSATAVTVICCLVSGVVTLLMSLYANLPFALSTGMGTNFMFGAMVQAGEISYGGAMAITLISGCIFILLTAFGVRDLIVKMIPKNIKVGIGTSIGFFIAYLGFKNSGIGSFSNGIAMGDYSNPAVLLALGGLFLIAALEANKVKGGILIGIAATTIAGLFINSVAGTPITNITKVVSLPDWSAVANVTVAHMDFKAVFTWSALPLIFICFCGDFFSTLGTILGVAGRVGMLDENGDLPNIGKPFMVDAIGTTIGAFAGCTTITTFVESASGVEAGGRTGLTSFVVGILFLLATFFAPLFVAIPYAATGPALIYIGFLLIGGIKNIDFSDFTELFGPFIMIMFTAFAGGIAVGICMGILSHIFIKLVTGKYKEIHLGMYILAIPLIAYFILA